MGWQAEDGDTEVRELGLEGGDLGVVLGVAAGAVGDYEDCVGVLCEVEGGGWGGAEGG